jgi:hypothetical protein
MENGTKICNYDLSIEAYNLVGLGSKKLGIRKAYFVDALIKRYAEHLINDISEKLEKYEEEEK